MAQPWAEQSILDRMVTAVERVRDRLRRATAALEAAGVPYAVAGGNAVAAWVATIDPAAVRNTPDVEILLRRDDLQAAERALSDAGLIRRQIGGVDLFFDGAEVNSRHGVRILFAEEKAGPERTMRATDIFDAVELDDFCVITLENLVRLNLTSFRNLDAMYLRDMLDVGLIDSTWTARLPADLAAKLQMLIDTPEG